MKTFKFFLASLFLMLCSVASAQQVVVTKTDGTVETFQPNEVDSVVYKPATKYYYYAGWECPMNEEDLARLAVEPYGACIGTTLGTYTKSNPLRLYDGEVVQSERGKYYMVIPNEISIYDSEGDASQMDQFDEITNIEIPNHKILQFQVAVKAIGGMMLR